jgi:hypothetical protein
VRSSASCCRGRWRRPVWRAEFRRLNDGRAAARFRDWTELTGSPVWLRSGIWLRSFLKNSIVSRKRGHDRNEPGRRPIGVADAGDAGIPVIWKRDGSGRCPERVAPFGRGGALNLPDRRAMVRPAGGVGFPVERRSPLAALVFARLVGPDLRGSPGLSEIYWMARPSPPPRYAGRAT